jgi:Iap family predicted aminopeptidase
LPNDTDYEEPYLLNYKDIVRENYGTVKKLIVKVYKKINNNNTIFEFWQHHPDLLVKH